jgi:pimeloyl-ACP methyl ester carboxylesterase
MNLPRRRFLQLAAGTDIAGGGLSGLVHRKGCFTTKGSEGIDRFDEGKPGHGASACRRAWLEHDEGGEKMNPRRTSSIVLVSFLMTLLLPPSAKTGELPAGVKTLRVNGYDMAYMESGSGRPLVMVHGAMSDYRSWAAQMEPFGRTNRAVAVSLRHYFPERWDGKGGSFSWQQHVADMTTFIAGLNAGAVDLIGHSRGGLVAFELVRAQPSLVRSLVLAEPGLVLDERGFGASLEGKTAARTAADERAARVKAVLKRFDEGDIDGGLEIFADAVGGPGSWKNFAETQRQMFRDNAWTIKGTEQEQRRAVSCQELGALGMPVLLVGGERSPARYGEILSVIEPCLKRRERVTIPNASHGMYRMNPSAFNASVAQFIASH